jgi:hypothetical protein
MPDKYPREGNRGGSSPRVFCPFYRRATRDQDCSVAPPNSTTASTHCYRCDKPMERRPDGMMPWCSERWSAMSTRLEERTKELLAEK